MKINTKIWDDKKKIMSTIDDLVKTNIMVTIIGLIGLYIFNIRAIALYTSILTIIMNLPIAISIYKKRKEE